MIASLSCPACGRVVVLYANGKIRPHYGAERAGLCSGAYLDSAGETTPAVENPHGRRAGQSHSSAAGSVL